MKECEKAVGYLNKFKNCNLSNLITFVDASQHGQGFILLYCLDNPIEVTAKQLSTRMNISMARVTTIIQKMEEYGLVYRQEKLDDKRVSSIHLTDLGKEEAKKLYDQSIHTISKVMNTIGAEEVDHFLDTLEKIKNVLEEEY